MFNKPLAKTQIAKGNSPRETDMPRLSSKKLGTIATFTSEDKIPVLIPPEGKDGPTNWLDFVDCLRIYVRRHCKYWRDFIETRKPPSLEMPLHPRWSNMNLKDIQRLGDILAPIIQSKTTTASTAGASSGDAGEADEADEKKDDDDDDDGSVYGDEESVFKDINFLASDESLAFGIFAKRTEKYKEQRIEAKVEGTHVHSLITAYTS